MMFIILLAAAQSSCPPKKQKTWGNSTPGERISSGLRDRGSAPKGKGFNWDD
ncbi:MAG TPA: hypothetical protein VMT30_06230 [Candidatus Saccharimonadia bacterium]|nr:hypothetical protein [Candidatus Saccharimonadia bacterium]